MGDHYHGRTRRDFFRTTFKGALAGATIFEEAFLRAGWARAQAQTASASLFTIEKVADGVFAVPSPQRKSSGPPGKPFCDVPEPSERSPHTCGTPLESSSAACGRNQS